MEAQYTVHPPQVLGQSAFFYRSEEHTSELQSRSDLVCRLLLEKKKKQSNTAPVGYESTGSRALRYTPTNYPPTAAQSRSLRSTTSSVHHWPPQIGHCHITHSRT